MVNNKTKEISDGIYNKYKLQEAYIYSENSLLSSICKLYSDVSKTLLKEHYRCHPKIIDFCNKKFYDGQLIILTDENFCDTPLEIYKTVQGNHERDHYNQRQIDVIVKEILPKLKEYKSIGVASPYRNQIDKLKRLSVTVARHQINIKEEKKRLCSCQQFQINQMNLWIMLIF